MTPRLSTRSLLELIELFERSSAAVVDFDGQRLRGVPAWDSSVRAMLSDRDLSAWLQRIGVAGSYPAPCGDEHAPVELVEDSNPERYCYRCPETFRTKYVAADLVGVHAVVETKLLHYLADVMAIPQAHRIGVGAPAIDGTLWRLGRMRVGQVQVDTWLSRGLLRSVEAVFAQLRQPALPEKGLVFTTGRALPDLVAPPRAYHIVPIIDTLVDHADQPTLDVDLIHRLLQAPAGSPLEKSLPVRFDPYSNTLVIATKSNKPWAIKGARQVAVVKHLFAQFVNDRRWVPAYEILDEVYGSQELGRSQRIQNIFSGNSIWQDYITGDGKGHYGFNLD